jgi:hypothetical protein
MVSEKIEANLALQAKALSGGLGATALNAAAKSLDHYRQKVREPDTPCQWSRSTAISTETKIGPPVTRGGDAPDPLSDERPFAEQRRAAHS